MRKVYFFLLPFLTLFLPCTLFSQWVPLDGPYGGEIINFVKTEHNLVITNSNTILISSDNGQRWTTTFSGSDSLNFQILLSNNSQKLFLITSNILISKNNRTIFISSDEGNSWSLYDYITPAYDSKCSLTDQRLTFILDSAGVYTLIYRNLDSSGWRKLKIEKDTAYYYEISGKKIVENNTNLIIDRNDNIFLAKNTKILRSTNSGQTFDEILSKDYIFSTKFYLDFKGNIYFITDFDANSIHFSTDYGYTWAEIKLKNQYFNLYIIDPQRIYYATPNTYNTNDLWLAEGSDTTDAAYISVLGDPYYPCLNYDTCFILDQRSTGQYYLTTDKYFRNPSILKFSLKTTNILKGGSNFIVSCGRGLGSAYDDKGNFMHNVDNFYSMFISNLDYMWYQGLNPIPSPPIFSKDIGITLEETIPYLKVYWMDQNSSNEIFSVDRNLTLYKTTDQIKWDSVTQFTGFNIFAVIFDDFDNLNLIESSYKHKFDGDLVSIFKINTSNNLIIGQQDLLLASILKKVIKANGHSFLFLTDSMIYKYNYFNNNLQTLLDKRGGDRIFNDILTVGDDIYVATNKGILRSADSGLSWDDFNDGLKSTNCLSLAKTRNNTIFAGMAYDVIYMNPSFKSVIETELGSKLLISPNPAGDYINITVGANGCSPESIKIFDVCGQEEHPPTPSYEEGELRVDVSALTPGVYFVRVGTKVNKFIKV